MAKSRTERIAELGMLANMPQFAGLEVLQAKAARAVSKSFNARRPKKKAKRKRKKAKRA